MLQASLLDLKKNLQSSRLLTEGNISKFIDLIERYNKGDWVYPGVLIRQLGITQMQAYQVLDMLKELDMLEVNYELYCHKCGQFKGPIYETIGQIPEELDCECCGEKLNPLEDTIVIYRVLFG